jgi:hypothetical protein
VGQAAVNCQQMVRGMKMLKDIEDNVETDPIDKEKYVKELSKVCWDMCSTEQSALVSVLKFSRVQSRSVSPICAVP